MTSTRKPISTAPDGTVVELPGRKEYPGELERVRKLVEEQRAMGREICVVMGMGFVGLVMAAIVADAEDENGDPRYFVVGLQRPSARSYWKIPQINKGVCPLESEDPEVPEMVARVANDKKTFTASFNEEVLSLADTVVVDVQCDIQKKGLANVTMATVEIAAFRAAIKTIGDYIPAHALVLIETTVPPGTTEQVVYPILQKRFVARGLPGTPLVAHSFERVMPGREYVSSIRDFWRVCAGVDKPATERCVEFLTHVLNTDEFPLTVLDIPLESETAKVMENSFRATLIAFSAEWGDFAEEHGVDLCKVIEAIKVRPTHSNMLFSGPGVGGYCLPKDGGFGMWSHRYLLGSNRDIFAMTPHAIDINDTRGFHVAELAGEALVEMRKEINGYKVLVLGCSYREDVGDTRYSPSELIVRKLHEVGAEVSVHDPYVQVWPEMRDQNINYDHSLARHFRRQQELSTLEVQTDLDGALKGMDCVVLSVRHTLYKELDPDFVVAAVGGPVAIVDAFGILPDAKIVRYLELGCAVRAVARGHVRRLAEQVRQGGTL
ncbi:MAG: nucleotide sugar dehydrogenase [Myxococcota bacterium]|jgi:nucleotide sugar dehydrogenase|nr:nucleotide sugar dehydrogenase [Myxococcota bacterium]